MPDERIPIDHPVVQTQGDLHRAAYYRWEYDRVACLRMVGNEAELDRLWSVFLAQFDTPASDPRFEVAPHRRTPPFSEVR